MAHRKPPGRKTNASRGLSARTKSELLLEIRRLRRKTNCRVEDRVGRRHGSLIEQFPTGVLYESAWRSSLDGMCATDEDGIIVDVNGVFARLVGEEESRIKGMSLFEILDTQTREAISAGYRKFFDSRPVGERREFSAVLRDGKERWLEISSTYVAHSGIRPLLLNEIRDITERRRIEDGLRESEQAYRILFEKSPSFVALNRVTGEFVDANENLLAFLGQPLANIVGKSALEIGLVDREQSDIFESAFVESNGVLDELEVTIRNPANLSSRNVLISARFIHLHGDVLVLSILADISERILSEEALRESEQKFRTIIEQSSDAVLLVDEDGMVIEWNRSCETLTGIERAGVIGKPYWEVHWNLMGQEGRTRKTLKDIRDLTLHMLKTGELPDSRDTCETVMLNKSGETRHCQQRWFLIKTDKGHRIASITRDFTERKRVQDELRRNEILLLNLFAATHAGVALVVNRIIVKTNESLCRMTGYTGAELTGQPTRLLYPDDQQYDCAGRILYEQGQKGGQGLEGLMKRKDGSLMDVYVYLSPFDSTDSSAGVAVTVLDISERKKAEKALESSMEQLHALTARLECTREEERKSLSQEVHDQLGQILTAITMDLMAIKKLGASDSVVKKLDSALALTGNAVNIVQDISARLRPRMLDNLGLLAAIEWQTEEFERRSCIRCERTLPEEELKIDEQRATAIFRILQEALTNVVRHARATRLKVNLTESKDEIALLVSDDGVGISDVDLTNPKSIGLLGIQERLRPFKGTSTIRRGSEGGTEVLVRIPKVAR